MCSPTSTDHAAPDLRGPAQQQKDVAASVTHTHTNTRLHPLRQQLPAVALKPPAPDLKPPAPDESYRSPSHCSCQQGTPTTCRAVAQLPEVAGRWTPSLVARPGLLAPLAHAQERRVTRTGEEQPVGKPTVRRHSRHSQHACMQAAGCAQQKKAQLCAWQLLWLSAAAAPYVAGRDDAVLCWSVVTSRSSGSHSATPASTTAAACCFLSWSSASNLDM